MTDPQKSDPIRKILLASCIVAGFCILSGAALRQLAVLLQSPIAAELSNAILFAPCSLATIWIAWRTQATCKPSWLGMPLIAIGLILCFLARYQIALGANAGANSIAGPDVPGYCSSQSFWIAMQAAHWLVFLAAGAPGRQAPAMEHWHRYLVDPKRFARHRAWFFVLGQTPCSDASVCWTHRGLSTLDPGLATGSDRYRIEVNLVPVLSGGLKTLGGRTPRRHSFADPLVCNRLDPPTARAQSPPKYSVVRRAPGGLVPRGRMPSSRMQQSLFPLDESFVDPQGVLG